MTYLANVPTPTAKPLTKAKGTYFKTSENTGKTFLVLSVLVNGKAKSLNVQNHDLIKFLTLLSDKAQMANLDKYLKSQDGQAGIALASTSW